jgi:SAM-dependent methyltransferase
MSGFSEQWLALREPVDHACRNPAVLETMLADLRQRHGQSLSSLRILDLGCGSGSNLRALAPHLGQQQHWTLVDHDQALLDAARDFLLRWADEVILGGTQELRLRKDTATLTVVLHCADLNADIQTLLATHNDLVTASALFDLVSKHWIDRLSDALTSPLYAVLNFDGAMSWRPSHPLDGPIQKAFNAHQQQDKGLGIALGPEATAYLEQALRGRGYAVSTGKSPWQINQLPSRFHEMLIDGIANAVIQAGLEQSQVNDWMQAHLMADECVVGHDDLYACPPPRVNG